MPTTGSEENDGGTCIRCSLRFIGHGKEAKERVKGLVLGVIVGSVTEKEISRCSKALPNCKGGTKDKIIGVRRGRRTPPSRRSHWAEQRERRRILVRSRAACRQLGARAGGRWRGCGPWLIRWGLSERIAREIRQTECGLGPRARLVHRRREQPKQKGPLSQERTSWNGRHKTGHTCLLLPP
jgi:hypothetical protein